MLIQIEFIINPKTKESRCLGVNITNQITLGREGTLGNDFSDTRLYPASGFSDNLVDGDADIDLTPYRGLYNGVSRRHAIIKYEKMDEFNAPSLLIADLGSTNGTLLNGKRLPPYRFFTLRDGDEIRFARLVAHVTFPNN